MAWTSWKRDKFGFSSWIWPWRSRSIAPQNNRDLNQVLLHLFFKFGGSSLNVWWFMARTSSGLTDTHTDRQTQATTIPEGQNWPRVKTLSFCGGQFYGMELNRNLYDCKTHNCRLIIFGFLIIISISNLFLETETRLQIKSFVYLHRFELREFLSTSIDPLKCTW